MNKIFFLVALLSTSTLSHAAKEKTAAPNKILWSAWYTVQINGTAQGYYSEEVEDRPGEKQISINQHWWERDPPLAIMETFIGAISSREASLKPIAFYVERKNDLGTVSSEARAAQKRVTVTLKPSGEKISATIPKNAILSTALGILMARNGEKNNRKPTDFSAIVEDPKDKKYNAQKGRFQLLGEKETIRGETCYAANTVFQNISGKWWLTKEGKLCRLLLPSANAKIELADAAEAKGYLKP